MLTDLVGAHADVIPRLAKGFLECDRYMTRPAIAAWLDRMIHSRIGIRVIAEHHLALHHPMDNWIGIVNTKLNPISLVRDVAHVVAELAEANYGSAPDVIVQGPSDTRFAYIPVHLEYMLTELIKNSVRATIEHKRAQRKKRGEQIGVGASEEYEPVVVTVAPGPGVVTFRISDQGGGIPYDDVTKAFEYSYTTVTSEEAKEADGYDDGGRVLADVLKADMERQTGGPMAGLGFGLPMSNIYGGLGVWKVGPKAFAAADAKHFSQPNTLADLSESSPCTATAATPISLCVILATSRTSRSKIEGFNIGIVVVGLCYHRDHVPLVCALFSFCISRTIVWTIELFAFAIFY